MLRIFTPLVSTSVRWPINLSLYCGGKSFQNFSSGIVFFIVSSVLTVGAGSELRESDPNCGSRIRNGQEFSRWRKILSVLAAETLFYRIWTFLICTRFIFASLRQKMNFHPDPKQVERGAFFNWEKTGVSLNLKIVIRYLLIYSALYSEFRLIYH